MRKARVAPKRSLGTKKRASTERALAKVPRVALLTPNVIVGKGIRAPRVFVERCVATVVRELSRTGAGSGVNDGTKRRLEIDSKVNDRTKGRVASSAALSARALKMLFAAGEMSVVFVSRDEIRRLNREFRGKDKPTDVLSFDPVENGSLGELVISLEVIRVQAREHDLSLNDELGYMILHGVLHLLGYDHEVSESGARRMFAIQDRIFEKFKGRW